MRSVLEGVAFSLRDALDVISPLVALERALAIGGGAASDLWLHLVADVLALPLLRPRQSQGPAYGAALLAWQGLGHTGSAASLALQENGRAFQPEEPERYREALSRYRRVRL